MTERWREIPGRPGYQISDRGQVWRDEYEVIDCNGRTRRASLLPYRRAL